MSVDPLQFKYPHYTPYQYAGNKPISFIDLDGLEEAKNIFNGDRAIQPILMELISNSKDEITKLAEKYGSITDKKKFFGPELMWQNIQKEIIKIERFEEELIIAKAQELNTDKIILDLKNNESELYDRMSATYSLEGELVKFYIRGKDFFDEGDSKLQGGSGNLPKFIEENESTIIQDQLFGNNSFVITVESDKPDRTYFLSSTGQDIFYHEFGHLFWMIEHPKEYANFIKDLKVKAKSLGRDFEKLYMGGHSRDDKSGKQANEFGKKKNEIFK